LVNKDTLLYVRTCIIALVTGVQGIDTLHCYKPNHAPIAPQTTSQRFAAVHAHRRLEQ
jgi:hypothetical protein